MTEVWHLGSVKWHLIKLYKRLIRQSNRRTRSEVKRKKVNAALVISHIRRQNIKPVFIIYIYVSPLLLCVCVFPPHCCSVIRSCLTLCDPIDCRMPSFHGLHHLLDFMSIESVMPYNDLILCHPLLLLSSIFPSIKVFSNESALCIRWSKYWGFSFNNSPSNEYSGLSSFRMDWFDLLAVQGTLKNLLQQHSSKASILLRSAFFTVQLSHLNIITGKTIALTRQSFVSKAVFLLFSTLSRFVIACLSRSKCLLIS